MKINILIILFLYIATLTCTASDNLHAMFKDNSEIRVYLGDVYVGVKNPHINANTFKTIFRDVLRKRLNIKFVPVDNKKDADVIITATIKGYIYRAKVLPSFWSTAAIIADTTAPKSAAKLVVNYKIIDPGKGKILLERKNFTTDVRRPCEEMLGEAAFKYAARKNINRFIYRAFYKQKDKHGLRLFVR